ncbi:unnamed protein product [Ambrosiozyma monospora]|uniref:Unnamed protein product n=1 Tax=Ambrosiozyma monospora TaxID=43982 RepID=A0A9W6YPS0_AMBMO|nr:unnamed protein product [Ambrosiozyma monospora]
MGIFKAAAKKEKKEANGVTPEDERASNPSTSSMNVSYSSVSRSNLPTEMKVIVDSRPRNMVHDMTTFDNLLYAEFWRLTGPDAVTFKKWDDVEWLRQRMIFQYFVMLKKLRANVKRMVGHYGVEFKKAKGLTKNQESDYQKAFIPLAVFGKNLEDLVVSRLKPVYDNNFFVDDKYVIEVLLEWFTKLEQYHEYFFKSMVYLATLSRSILPWIEEAEKTDEDRNNRYLVRAEDLFTFFFLKHFNPLYLMAVEMKKIYVRNHEDKMAEMAARLSKVLQDLAKCMNQCASTSFVDESYSSVSRSNLSTEMKVIVDSRPRNMVHDMTTFDNLQYGKFWGLTDPDAVTFRKWDDVEFSRQCKIFQYFMLLKKFRANVKRMVGHYGVEFKKAKGLTKNQESDYEKTFAPLAIFGKNLEDLVVSRLKPVYDNNFFVDDKYVIEVSLKWFTKLEQYHEYFFKSTVYLATLSRSILPWIEEAEQTDEDRNNRYLVRAEVLFTSFFLKHFNMLYFMAFDLKEFYVRNHEDNMAEMAARLCKTCKTCKYLLRFHKMGLSR